MIRVGTDMMHESLLLFIERTHFLFIQEFGKTDNGMQPRAQFVTNAGDEFALEPVEPFLFLVPRLDLSQVTLLERLDLPFSALSFRHIADHRGGMDAVFVAHWAEADFDGKFGAIFTARAQIEPKSHWTDYSSLFELLAMRRVPVPARLRHQVVHLHTDQLITAVAKHQLRGPIGKDDLSARIHLQDRIRRAFNQFAEFTLGEHLCARSRLARQDSFLFGQIAGNFRNACDRAGSVADRRYAERDCNLRSILAQTSRFVVIDAFTSAQPREDRYLFLPQFLRYKNCDRFPHHFTGGIPEDPLCAGIPACDHAIKRLADN